MFLQILAQLGATEQEVTAAEQMITVQKEVLRSLGFSTAIKKIAEESVLHFQNWCQEHGLDYRTMDEPEIDHLLADALAQVRTR